MDARRRSARLNPPEPSDLSHVATTSSHESARTASEDYARPTGSQGMQPLDITSLKSGAPHAGSKKKSHKIPTVDISYKLLSQDTSKKLVREEDTSTTLHTKTKIHRTKAIFHRYQKNFQKNYHQKFWWIFQIIPFPITALLRQNVTCCPQPMLHPHRLQTPVLDLPYPFNQATFTTPNTLMHLCIALLLPHT